MQRMIKETLIRVQTGPALALPRSARGNRPHNERRLGGVTPMEAEAAGAGGCLQAPPGSLAGRWESRQAFLQPPWQPPPGVIIEEREDARKAPEKAEREGQLAMYTDGSEPQSPASQPAPRPT
ncbi:hypothetical protein P168DRAFT_318897 [Aspergillus campestris IBT 28561]|uniref:Uncharacterized protein n=1 Tax=Aspergillus campestris (strain IBT 28561) TaxID=1392248 RepID=A0A2I1D3X3_ASPC2|nr:uncharacterized protein P168DRAFT_318897 [Aspergillus campestris IBT 28561]PKY04573.1 hypothetical protein P168DRAFT_318897 [Aspergillus campestris IBT 28561]